MSTVTDPFLPSNPPTHPPKRVISSSEIGQLVLYTLDKFCKVLRLSDESLLLYYFICTIILISYSVIYVQIAHTDVPPMSNGIGNGTGTHAGWKQEPLHVPAQQEVAPSLYEELKLGHDGAGFKRLKP